MSQSHDPFADDYVEPVEPVPSGVVSEKVDVHPSVTVTIDIDELLKSELGWSTYNAGTYNDPEPDFYPGGNGRLIDLVTTKLAAALREDVREPVREAVKEAALAKVDGLIEDVLEERIHLTNSLGEKTGGPGLTMREAMIKAMTDRLDQRVDDNGKPIAMSGSWGADRGYSYLAWHSSRLAKDILDKELSAKLSEAAKTIRDRAKEMVSAKMAAAFTSGL